MPAVNFSPFGNSQFVTSAGAPAVGWKLYTYAAGSSTPQTTYTDSTGTVAQTNPIIINSLGFPTNGQLWLTSGLTYKIVLTDASDVVQKTEDNITGVTGTSSVSEWVASGLTPTYISATSFTLSGDQTSTFRVGRRLQSTNTSGTIYSTITASAYAALTTITVVNDSGSLDSGLSAVNYGLLSTGNTSVPRATSSQVVAGTSDVVFLTPLTIRGWVLVSSSTASASAQIDFSLSGTDDTYMVVMENIVPATDGAILYSRVSQASAYKTDASYQYTSILTDASGGAPGGAVASTAATFCQLSGAVNNTTAEGGVSGEFFIYGATSTAYYKKISAKLGGNRSGVGHTMLVSHGAYRGSTAAVDGLRFYFSSGNIASGTFYLYKLRKA